MGVEVPDKEALAKWFGWEKSSDGWWVYPPTRQQKELPDFEKSDEWIVLALDKLLKLDYGIRREGMFYYCYNPYSIVVLKGKAGGVGQTWRESIMSAATCLAKSEVTWQPQKTG